MFCSFSGLPQALLNSQKSPILEFWEIGLFQKVRKPYIWEMAGLWGVLYKLGSSPRRPQALFSPTKNRSQDFWTCPIQENCVLGCFWCFPAGRGRFGGLTPWPALKKTRPKGGLRTGFLNSQHASVILVLGARGGPLRWRCFNDKHGVFCMLEAPGGFSSLRSRVQP